MKHLLHVSLFSVRPPKALVESLESVFATADDWMRYAPNCWLLWTSQDVAFWATKVKAEFLKDDESLFVCRIDPTGMTQGWLQPWMWDWINKHIREASKWS